MPEPGHGDGLDVIRRREVAAVQRGAAAGELQQRQRAAWTGADLESRARPSRADDLDDVAAEAVGDMDVLDRALHREQRLPVDHRVQLDLVLAALESPFEDRPLVVGRRIADLQAEQETVELRLRKR